MRRTARFRIGNVITGLSLVILAAGLQGTFLLPMRLIKRWQWEHSWAVFTLFGMLLLNWTFSFAVLPHPAALFSSVPSRDLVTLSLFGAGWGIGAVLFGLGMDKLGLALGYPLIMGLSASLGALLPLLYLRAGSLSSVRGFALLAGTAVALIGIAICSLAGARRQTSPGAATGRNPAFAAGLFIALAAGCLCCLPNIGMTFGQTTVAAARGLGASESSAANAVWGVFFTFGGLVNLGYCGFRMARQRNLPLLFGAGSLRNWALALAMAALWIGSFYCYGAGTSKMGGWGAVIGWPALISLSIGVGVLGGIWQGEWKSAPARAQQTLRNGLLLILAAVMILASGNAA